MKIIPLFGSSTKGKSSTITAQRRVNCYYENRPDGDKSKIVILGTPGTIVYANFGAGPSRGIIGTTVTGSTLTGLFSVSGSQVWGSTSAPNVTPGNATYQFTVPGTLSSTTGLVSMAYQPNQIVITDGQNGYLLTIVSTGMSVAQISPWQATGAKTVTFVSGFFVAEQPGTQKFWVSNFGDGSTWGSLAFASASAYSDNILAVDNLLGNLIIFSQYHTEFWQDIGTVPQPFAPLLAAVNEYGLAAIWSRAHVDQSLIFLAQTKTGAVQAVEISGYNANPISDADMDTIWNDFTTVSDATALSYEIGQHKFYQLTFPTMNRSFLYDCATRVWSEVQTGVSEIPVRHTANLSTVWQGQTFLADYATSAIYTQSDKQYTDIEPPALPGVYTYGTPIVREVISRHVLSNFNRIRISFIYFDMEVGQYLAPGVGSNVGNTQGGPAMVVFQYSWDNGRHWSKERWISLGMQGEYKQRVVIRRMRSARDFVFKLRMTDPVKWVITEAAIKMSERQPAEKLG